VDNRKLFQPLPVRGMVLKNRLVALPTGLSGYTDSTHTPTERYVALYGRKALGGAALITVGIVYVEPYPITQNRMMGFYSDDQIPAYSVLTNAIHRGGAHASLQITDRWHFDFPYEMDDLTTVQIEAMIDHYVRGALRARAAGFDAVEIEVAHGWPLARFTSPLTNHRHDRYGEYSAVPCEVIGRIRGALGNEFPVIARVSIIDDLVGGRGITLEQSVNELCPAFEDAGTDVLSVTFGLGPIEREVKDYQGTETIYYAPGDKFDYIKQVTAALNIPVLGRSRVTDPHLPEQAVGEGWVDLVGMARQLLADPFFPAKIEDRAYDEVERCIGCDYCSRGTSRFGTTLHCTVNPSLGRELDERAPRPSVRRPKSVAIVGGGPAGMELALLLEERRWHVTLIERDERLGGLLRWVVQMPQLRLEDLQYLVDSQERRIASSSVKVMLGTEFTSSMLKALDAEVLVLATGSVPPDFRFEGKGQVTDGVSVCTYLDYLSGRPIGNRVVVDGRGEGAEFAVSLARGGHEVTLVEASPRLLQTEYDYAGRRQEALHDYLAETGVSSYWSSHVVGINGRSVAVRGRSGRLSEITADTLLVAGRTPVKLNMDGAKNGSQAVYEIGDCARPRGIAEALDSARILVNSLAG
jgi:2,4-dienoyl-CoA reductase-like NADH-dependent reductase (Old Yellow Enzyme family)/thioredoxin reductase